MARRKGMMNTRGFTLSGFALQLNPEARSVFLEIKSRSERMRIARGVAFEKALFEDFIDDSREQQDAKQ